MREKRSTYRKKYDSKIVYRETECFPFALESRVLEFQRLMHLQLSCKDKGEKEMYHSL